jgi:hypothetical protein
MFLASNLGAAYCRFVLGKVDFFRARLYAQAKLVSLKLDALFNIR